MFIPWGVSSLKISGWYRKQEDWLLKKERNQRRPGCRRKKMGVGPSFPLGLHCMHFVLLDGKNTVCICMFMCACVRDAMKRERWDDCVLFRQRILKLRIYQMQFIKIHFLVSSCFGPRLWRRERASSSISLPCANLWGRSYILSGTSSQLRNTNATINTEAATGTTSATTTTNITTSLDIRK